MLKKNRQPHETSLHGPNIGLRAEGVILKSK